ncbi:enoyl-CoA hydratase/isomerase family protein [Rhodococcus erythropolis]|uniref:enoyl-CoA hydratase/isomerase family protein n=1 Tax=Rhodococcus erythropolis TaxID=1833 RepID=UPI001F1E788F|nr:enoyl-CoA hydratase/isomerase family protein [Rhodococcus erythropolis]
MSSQGNNFRSIEVALDATGVGTVVINRPDRLNALNGSAIDELVRALEWLGSESRCRVVVLAGRGTSFCAGMDMSSGLGSRPFDDPVLETEYGVRRAVEVVKVMRRIPQPIVVAVQGHAVGAGFAIAAAADIRIASTDAQFNAVFVKIGVSAGDLGLTWILPRIIGSGRAADLLLRGGVLNADDALAQGFVSSISEDPRVVAESTAHEIAALPAYGVAATKQLLNASVDAAGLDQHLESELRAQTVGLLTADHKAAVASFRDRRLATRN